MYTVQPERSHSRLSLRRVLYVKFLRWIDKSQAQTIVRSIRHGIMALVVFTAAVAPSYLLGFLTSLTGNKFVFGLFAVLVYLNYKTFVRQVRRLASRHQKGNQHTFHSVPVPELADFLIETSGFPFKDSMKILGISQPQYRKIATDLETHGVLVRGESNARILRPISRTDLIKQLMENFPLTFSDHEQEWVRKRDTFAEYVLDRERKERKEEERVEKRARKLHRIEKKIADLSNPFTVRELHIPAI